jgi:tetratricopeptide (TPR) repeat protein
MNALLLVAFHAVFAIEQTAWVNLAKLAREKQVADNFGAAEALRREAVRLAETELGPNDKRLAPILADLAINLHLEGRDADGEPFAQRAVSIARESGDQRLMGLTLNSLGIVLSGEGKKERAEPVLRRSLALLAPGSLDSARAANNLATLYLDTGQYDKAEEQMRIAVPIYEQRLGLMDPETALVWGNLFTVLAAQHRAAEGEPKLRRAMEIGELTFPKTLNMANLQLCLAALDETRGNFKEEAGLLEKVIATQERVLGPEHPAVGHTLAAYANALRHLNQKNAARNALHRANSILKASSHHVE